MNEEHIKPAKEFIADQQIENPEKVFYVQVEISSFPDTAEEAFKQLYEKKCPGKLPDYEIQFERKEPKTQGWLMVSSTDKDCLHALLDLHLRKIDNLKVETRLMDFHDLQDEFGYEYVQEEVGDFQIEKIKPKEKTGDDEFEVIKK